VSQGIPESPPEEFPDPAEEQLHRVGGAVLQAVGGVLEAVGGVLHAVGGVLQAVGGVLQAVGGVLQAVRGVLQPSVGGVLHQVVETKFIGHDTVTQLHLD
jgi:hypothetical protein